MKFNRFLFATCGVIALATVVNVATADAPAISGGGNFTNGEVTADVDRQFKVLTAAGAQAMRMSVYPYWYTSKDGPTPQMEDAQVLKAHDRGVQTIIIQFEYEGAYAKLSDPRNQLGDAQKWKEIGSAFAARFGPNSDFLVSHGIHDWGVRIFEAMNEADNVQDNAVSIPLTGPSSYVSTLEGLADGVHAVNRNLAVIPGGLCSECSSHNHTCNGYGSAIASLLNEGKLDGIDFHTYNDILYAPLIRKDGEITPDWLPQAAFDNVKKACGITRDINFYCTEYNFKSGEQGIDENLAAKRLLTCIWANLGVVKSDGHTSATQLALAWNLFNTTAKDQTYGMTAADSGDAWQPTARGKTFQMVMGLTAGKRFTHLDPLDRGEFRLQGNGATMWVWQNYPKLSSIHGNRYTVTDIPKSASTLKVYGWDGLRKSIDLHGLHDVSDFSFDDLNERETYMFVASP